MESEGQELTTLIQERYNLVMERLRGIRSEKFPIEELHAYFQSLAQFLLSLEETREKVLKEREQGIGDESLSTLCAELLTDLYPENYEESYANPAYMEAILGNKGLGENYSRLLSALYFEEKTRAAAAYDDRAEDLLIHMELFVEVYASFLYEWEESGTLPDYESLRQILYWFVWDYSELAAEPLNAWTAGKERFGAEGTGAEGAELLLACGRHGLLEDGCPWYVCGEEPPLLQKVFEDHQEDRALLWDRSLVSRKLEIYRGILENGKEKGWPVQRVLGMETGVSGPVWRAGDRGKGQLWNKYWRKMEEICKEFAVFPGNV